MKEIFENISNEITRAKTIDPFLGALIGDIAGSIYEWNNASQKNEISLKVKTRRATDDSVLSCAVADWIVESENGTSDNQAEILNKKLDEYGHAFPKAGYGHMFRKWLAAEKKEPINSFGNGSGMRCSACGCAAKTYTEVLSLAKKSAEVTHNHPEGIKGAQAISYAIWSIINGTPKEYLKEAIETEFGYDLSKTVDEIHGSHGFNATCQVTVPEAIIAFLEGNSFEEVFEKAIWVGGDSDTIACMACALAGAYYGIPENLREELFELLKGTYPKLYDAVEKFSKYCEV